MLLCLLVAQPQMWGWLTVDNHYNDSTIHFISYKLYMTADRYVLGPNYEVVNIQGYSCHGCNCNVVQ